MTLSNPDPATDGTVAAGTALAALPFRAWALMLALGILGLAVGFWASLAVVLLVRLALAH